MRRSFVATKMDLVKGERADVSLITTDAIDRDFEVIYPKGGDWRQFKRNPVVTFNHQYAELPVGRSMWVKRERGEKSDGWLAKTQYTGRPDTWPKEAPWFPDAVWWFVSSGDLPGKSIGFIPLEYRAPTSDEIKARPELADVRAVIPRWLALEYAVATVQSNPDAIVQQVAKAKTAGVGVPDVLLEELGLIIPEPPQPFAISVDGEACTLDFTDDDGADFEAVTKPYPNEHACRLRDPSEFSKFRRGSREHEGKKYSIIFGQPKDGSGWKEQAYRYPKDTWKASEAKAHCAKHDGKFEAARQESADDGCGCGKGSFDSLSKADQENLVAAEVARQFGSLSKRIPEIVQDALDTARGKV